MIATACLMACAQGAAEEIDISLQAGLRVQTGHLALRHDASGAFPIYGNPTSILEYDPLTSMGLELGLSGRSADPDGAWFDLVAGLPLAGQGTFRDTDYFAGQVLFSDTLSDAGRSWQAHVTGRVPVPGVESFAAGDWQVRPYGVFHARVGHLSARGLSCGVICGPLPDIGEDVEVIGHGVFGIAAGAGLWLENKVSASDTLDLRIEASGGYLGVRDSHHFRTDLGPTPNIAFAFGAATARAEFAYTRDLAENTAISAEAFGAVSSGVGAATFGSGLDPAIGRFPARLWEVSGGVSLSGSVRF